MKNTIETPMGTLTKVEVIWDRDHGTANEGWYVRSTYADGTIEDDTNCPACDLPRDTSREQIVSEVTSWLAPPDGLSDDEMVALRAMIELR